MRLVVSLLVILGRKLEYKHTEIAYASMILPLNSCYNERLCRKLWVAVVKDQWILSYQETGKHLDECLAIDKLASSRSSLVDLHYHKYWCCRTA